MNASYLQPPVKPMYNRCPQCHGAGTTLQQKIEFDPISAVPSALHLYCPNCDWSDLTPLAQPKHLPETCHDCGKQVYRLDDNKTTSPKNIGNFSNIDGQIRCPACFSAFLQQLLKSETVYKAPNHPPTLKDSDTPEETTTMKMVDQHFNDSIPVGSDFAIHETGAMRSTDADSVRFDLIPQRMLLEVATVMATGAAKYGEHNWKKGFKWSSCLNHCARHLYLYLTGDKKEHHLAHMVCNLGFLIEFETSHPELNDIPSRQ